MAENDPQAWNARYVESSDGWTLDAPPPVLVRLLEGWARGRGPLRVIVPGAGRGVDALAWARAGHAVTALDFAPLAVEGLREAAAREGQALEVHEADVSAPPPALSPRLEGAFDVLWEQTCLCAIPPSLRRPYLEQARRWLAPGGQMIALLWNHGREGGPPHDMAPALVDELIAGLFTVDRREPVEASNPERVPECLYWLRPQGAQAG